MWKRMIAMLLVLGAVLAALGFFKFQQIQAAIQAGASYEPPPEAVTTVIAREDSWPSTMSVIGTVAAVQGVSVSADLPGVVSKISFESGGSVREGDILVELDTKQEQAQLASAEAERDLARLNFARLDGLVAQGAVSKSEYDRTVAEQKQSEAKVNEIRATIERKTIRAPFSGILGIRQVNLGQYLSAGNVVVALQSLDPIYVNFGVPQQDAAKLDIGGSVRITGGDGQGAVFSGRITAKDSQVDEKTRNMQVQATLANSRGTLRPGMFVQVEVRAGARRSVVPLPASAISYAPYGDSVFIVTTVKDGYGQSHPSVKQQFVKTGGSRGDQVAVISGIKPGEEVVTSGVFKLRNGAAVLVNNKVTPSNDPAPKPEDS